MNTIFIGKVSACAMLLGILSATSGPAAAKVTIACKQSVQTGYAAQQTTKDKARSGAKHAWVNAVNSQYGAYWSSYSNAKNKQYFCVDSPHGWMCYLKALPCAQVTPPSHSAHQLQIRPQQWRRSQNKRSLQRYRFAPPVRTQILRSQFRSNAPRSISRLR